MRNGAMAVAVLAFAGMLAAPVAAQIKVDCRTSNLAASINAPRSSISMDVVQGANCGRVITSPGGGSISNFRVVTPPRAGGVQVAGGSAFQYTAPRGYTGGDSFVLAWTREAGGPQVMMFEVVMTVRVNVWSSAEAMARGGPAPGQAEQPRAPQPAQPPQPGQAAAPPMPGGGRTPYASATGFFINRGSHILTNEHVIRECREITISRSVEQRFTAAVLMRDAQNDLAVLASTLLSDHWARFERESPRAGDAAVAIGYPLRGLLAFQPNVTAGNISALAGLRGDARHVQITAPIQPGNSGGPVLSQRGAVIGVVNATINSIRVAQQTGTIPQNINFAINVSVVRQFLTTSRIAFDLADDAAAMRSAPDIGEDAARFTVSVECYR